MNLRNQFGLEDGDVVAKQQEQIAALASQIQKVSDQLGTQAPGPRVVANN